MWIEEGSNRGRHIKNTREKENGEWRKPLGGGREGTQSILEEERVFLQYKRCQHACRAGGRVKGISFSHLFSYERGSEMISWEPLMEMGTGDWKRLGRFDAVLVENEEEKSNFWVVLGALLRSVPVNVWWHRSVALWHFSWQSSVAQITGYSIRIGQLGSSGVGVLPGEHGQRRQGLGVWESKRKSDLNVGLWNLWGPL